MHIDFSMGMEGGFFLMKKPLSSMASVYTNSENAIATRTKTWRGWGTHDITLSVKKL
jgi:hypothetical protein